MFDATDPSTSATPGPPGSSSRTSMGGALGLLRGPLPLQRESALFLIVNILDVLMTYMLLADMPGTEGRIIFYESNPVARFFLHRWDVRGIVYFKFGMVAIVEIIAHVVAMKKVAVGRRLLEFGTLVVSIVVLYSMFLMLAHR